MQEKIARMGRLTNFTLSLQLLLKSVVRYWLQIFFKNGANYFTTSILYGNRKIIILNDKWAPSILLFHCRCYRQTSPLADGCVCQEDGSLVDPHTSHSPQELIDMKREAFLRQRYRFSKIRAFRGFYSPMILKLPSVSISPISPVWNHRWPYLST
jgi:hypothetical protein